jgi:alpha-tubulin suppressor-like RCC1 family protein
MTALALLLPLAAVAAPAAPAAPPAFDGQLSGNGSHACLLRPTHDVVCWGLDLQNTRVAAPTGDAARVPGLTDAQEIAVGVAHACAIRSGGEVVCWGYAGLGQLGTPPEKAFHPEPAPVPGLTDAVHLASGANRTCAVRADGTVWCWGSWDPYVPRDAAPAPVPRLTGVSALVFGDAHTCALQQSGKVQCWGDNLRGECGNGRRDQMVFAVKAPEPVVGLDDAVQLSAARMDTCALRKTGQVVCWGDRSGAFVTPDKKAGATYALSPAPVPGATGAKAVLLTDTAGCLLRAKDNQLACWWPPFAPWAQADAAKQKTAPNKLADVKLPALAKVTRQLLSAEETYALTAGGKVWHWGGRGVRQPREPVKGLKDAVAVSTGINESCAVRANGTVACWGAVGSGIESSGTDAPPFSRFSPTPVQVPRLAGAVAVASGGAHACALDKAGAVSCWGNNAAGQLGNGKKGAGLSAALRAKAKITSPAPPAELMPREPVSKVKLAGKAVQVAAGGNSTCALLETGAVQCWGDNHHGQLGAVPGTASLSPVAVPGLTDVARIALGDGATCAAKRDGTVLCWGRDPLGLTATPLSNPDLLAPTVVPGVTGVVDLALGEGRVCAVMKDGAARCWGRRSRFLGDGDPNLRGGALAQVKDVTDAAAIALGADQQCVRRSTGAVACWGRNLWGVLGDGTRIDRNTPVEVLGLGPVRSISAGEAQTCAVRANGTVVCWGSHAAGGLGDGLDPTAPRELALLPPTPGSAPAPAAAAPPAPAVTPAAASAPAPHP